MILKKKTYFWGNNEYRYFDIRSLRFLSEEINNIELVNNRYEVNLKTL